MPKSLPYKPWTPKQIQMQHLLANPFDERLDKEKCIEVKITPKTLCEWKKLPGWQDAIHKITLKCIGDKVPNVLKGLYRKASKRGDAQEVKLFLEILGLYTERRRIDLRAGRLEELSDEELDQIIKRARGGR